MQSTTPMTLGEFADFYPDFDRLCRQRVIAHFPEPGEDPEEDDAEE